jgi:hypothetical protein
MAVAVVGRRFGQSDNDELSVGCLQHFHRHAVEAAERGCGDDLARLADDRLPGAEVDDAIEIGEQRVYVVRDEQDRHRPLAADVLKQRSHRTLIGQVEAVQRLIEDQQPWLADERLGDQQPLLLAA